MFSRGFNPYKWAPRTDHNYNYIYIYIYTYIYIYSISELHWLQHFSINIYLENEYLTSCFVRLLKIPFFVTPLRSLPPPQPNSWHVSREGVFLSKHIPVYGYFNTPSMTHIKCWGGGEQKWTRYWMWAKPQRGWLQFALFYIWIVWITFYKSYFMSTRRSPKVWLFLTFYTTYELSQLPFIDITPWLFHYKYIVNTFFVIHLINSYFLNYIATPYFLWFTQGSTDTDTDTGYGIRIWIRIRQDTSIKIIYIIFKNKYI